MEPTAPKPIIRTLKVEIKRPVDRTWAELGALLSVQRRIIPVLLRAGMDAKIATGVVPVDVVKGAVCPTAKANSPQGVAYQAMLRELERIRSGKWSDAARPALSLCGGMVAALGRQSIELMGITGGLYRAGHGDRRNEIGHGTISGLLWRCALAIAEARWPEADTNEIARSMLGSALAEGRALAGWPKT